MALGLLRLLFASPISNYRSLHQTIYVITPDRAIILSGKRVFSQWLTPNTRFRLSGAVPETLEIWDAGDQARAEVPPMLFQQLPDGEAAAVLQRLLKGETPLNN